MLAYSVVTCESSYCLVFPFGASFLAAFTALATACFTLSDTTAFTVCARAPARCPAHVHSKQPCTDGNQEHRIVLDDCTVYYVCPLPHCDSYTTYSSSLLDCRALTLCCPPFTMCATFNASRQFFFLKASIMQALLKADLGTMFGVHNALGCHRCLR